MEFRRSTSRLDELSLIDPAEGSFLVEHPPVSHSDLVNGSCSALDPANGRTSTSISGSIATGSLIGKWVGMHSRVHQTPTGIEARDECCGNAGRSSEVDSNPA